MQLQNGSQARILIFLIAIGADYSFYVKSIATFALTFFGYIISVLASVDTLGPEMFALGCLFQMAGMRDGGEPLPLAFQYGNNGTDNAHWLRLK